MQHEKHTHTRREYMHDTCIIIDALEPYKINNQSRMHDKHLFLPRYSKGCKSPYHTQQIDWGFFSEWIDILIPLQAWTATSLWYHLPSIQGASLVSLTYRWVGIEIRFVGWTMLNREVSNKAWKRCEKMKVLGKWLPQLGLRLGSWFWGLLWDSNAGKAMNPRRFCRGNCQVFLQLAAQVKSVFSILSILKIWRLNDEFREVENWSLTVFGPHDYPNSIPKVVQIWRP